MQRSTESAAIELVTWNNRFISLDKFGFHALELRRVHKLQKKKQKIFVLNFKIKILFKAIILRVF